MSVSRRDKYHKYLTAIYFSKDHLSSPKQNYTIMESQHVHTGKTKLIPEDTGLVWEAENREWGRGWEIGALFPQLRHSAHGWSQISGELSREAADQAINEVSNMKYLLGCQWALECLSSWFSLTTVFRLGLVLWSGQHSLRSRIMYTPLLHSIIWNLFMEPRGQNGVTFHDS